MQEAEEPRPARALYRRLICTNPSLTMGPSKEHNGDGESELRMDSCQDGGLPGSCRNVRIFILFSHKKKWSNYFHLCLSQICHIYTELQSGL